MPYYGSSTALEEKNGVEIGVVCNLVNGLVYVKDEEKILSTYDLNANVIDESSKIHSEAKFGIFERAYAFPNICLKLKDEKIKYRSPGAVALSLVNAKYYNFVLFCGEIREFDIKAALYICSNLNVYQTKDILLVAKNKNIFSKLKNLLNNNRL